MLNIFTFATLLASAAHAAPSTIEARVADKYNLYSGNGSPSSGWPAMSAWGSFDSLWKANLPLMQQSCGWNGWGANNSPGEIADMRNAINSVSAQANIDARFVLAIIMQESKGCVRVPTTTSPDGRVRNPGLMQDHNGTGTCAGKNPCPASAITQMIKDGTLGTQGRPGGGDGLKQTLAQASQKTKDSAQAYYAAARIYNSGSATYENLRDGRGATNCYATDVANRLTGWAMASTKCY